MKIKLLLKFFPYLKPYWTREALVLVLMIATSLCSLAPPFFLKLIIDEAFPARDYTLLMQILLALVATNFARVLLTGFSEYLYEWLGNHVVSAIRTDLFNHLIRLPVGFFEKNKTGDMINRISSDVNSVQSIITGSITRFAHSFFMVTGLTLVLCWLNVQLLVAALAALPIVLVCTRYFQPRVRRLIKESREKDADIMAFFIEQFENIKLLKSYNNYGHESAKLAARTGELIGVNLKTVVLSASAKSISMFLMSVSSILIFAVGGQQVMQQAMSIGALVAFLQYFNRLQAPARDLMSLYVDLMRASVSMQRIFEFFELEAEPGEGAPVRITAGRPIEFRNVGYAYGATPVLENFNLKLEAGRKYALVGPSGCGKSTLINLLCRFHLPSAGIITIDGVGLNHFSLAALRQSIALVSQDNLLFRGSVWENIQYGDLAAPMQALAEVARCTGVYELAERTKGPLETGVGERGAMLSGGQKQRIAIARALLKSADVVILDEATSALDLQAEKEVLGNLFRLCEAKTIILISHRLSSIQAVDEIICLDKGGVIEKGTHCALIDNYQGYYRSFFHAQTLHENAGKAVIL